MRRRKRRNRFATSIDGDNTGIMLQVFYVWKIVIWEGNTLHLMATQLIWHNRYTRNDIKNSRKRNLRVSFPRHLKLSSVSIMRAVSSLIKFQNTVLWFSLFNNFNTWTVHLLLFCIATDKCTIISQIIRLFLHVSTLTCHPQGACNQYLAKSHKYVKCSSW